jgi:hypothetical protein
MTATERIRRSTLAGALSLAALLLLPAAGSLAADEVPADEVAADAERPGIWSGRAVAAAIHLAVNTSPSVIPFEDFIRMDAPEGDSRWDSSGFGQARASTAYPGGTGTGGLAALCDFGFPCPDGFPPPYAWSTTAEQGFQPESSTQDRMARARADEEGVETYASFAGIPGMEPLAPVITAASVEARTAQFFEGPTLVVEAGSRITDLVLFGGALTIDSLESVSVSRTNGEDVEESTSAITVAGVTAGGQPAEISADGIVIAGQGSDEPVRQANAALEQAMAQFDATVQLVTTDPSENGANRAAATALRIDFRIPLEGPPLPNPFPPEFPVPPGAVYRDYLVTVLLGRSVAESRADAFDLGDLGDLADLGDLGEGFGGEGFGDDSFDDGFGGDGVQEGGFGGGGFDAGSTVAVADPFQPDFGAGGAGPQDVPAAATPDEGADGQRVVETQSAAALEDEAASLITRFYLVLMVLSASLLGATRLGRIRGVPFDDGGGLA